MAAAGQAGVQFNAWEQIERDFSFATFNEHMLNAMYQIVIFKEGFGAADHYLQCDRLTDPTIPGGKLLQKGDLFVIPLFEIEFDEDDNLICPAGEPFPPDHHFAGCVTADFVFNHAPWNIFEVISIVPKDADDEKSGHLVQAKLVKTFPARNVEPGFSLPETTHDECPLNYTITIKWRFDHDFVIRPTLRLDTFLGVAARAPRLPITLTSTAKKTDASVFTGILLDCDGMPLMCLDKAHYEKEEARSLALRRAIDPERSLVFFGDKGYVLDVDHIIKKLEEAYSDPMHIQSTRPSWASTQDVSTAIKGLPVILNKKIFTAFLEFNGDPRDTEVLSLKHFLQPGVTFDANDKNILMFALGNFQTVLAHVFGDKYSTSMDKYRIAITGNLHRFQGKHLWYASDRAYMNWQTTLKSHLSSSSSRFQGRSKLIPVHLLEDCFDDVLNPDFMDEVRKDWENIQLNISQLARPASSSSTSDLISSKKRSIESTSSTAGADTQSDRILKKRQPVENEAMCTNFANLQLQVPKAPGCRRLDCTFSHYKLGMMSLADAKTLIEKHATANAKGRLLSAAEAFLK